MRVTAVDMYSDTLEEAISFNLQNAGTKDQYHVRTILGLDTDDIVPKFYGWSLDGASKFYDFSIKPRDIVMRIVLNPRIGLDESFSDVRDELYKKISANRTGMVVLHLRDGAIVVGTISGSITKFEAAHFTNKPEVQLTIHCTDPFFRGISPVIFDDAGLPTTNPIVIPDGTSTAPHGFSIKATLTNPIPSFTIQDDATTPTWKFKVTPQDGFYTGDTLYISSEYSNKYVYIVRSAVTIQLADRIEPNAVWPIIFPGANSFHFSDLANCDLDEVKYYSAFWGV